MYEFICYFAAVSLISLIKEYKKNQESIDEITLHSSKDLAPCTTHPFNH